MPRTQLPYKLVDIKTKRMYGVRSLKWIESSIQPVSASVFGHDDEFMIGTQYRLIQCTGLFDSDEKLIWEDDLLSVTQKLASGVVWTEVGVMRWCPQLARFGAEVFKEGLLSVDEDMEVRVIGNIYQNPDMIPKVW